MIQEHLFKQVSAIQGYFSTERFLWHLELRPLQQSVRFKVSTINRFVYKDLTVN